MQSRINDVHTLTRVYDLLVWMVPVLEKFPRSQKFLVGDRIETGLIEFFRRSAPGHLHNGEQCR